MAEAWVAAAEGDRQAAPEARQIADDGLDVAARSSPPLETGLPARPPHPEPPEQEPLGL